MDTNDSRSLRDTLAAAYRYRFRVLACLAAGILLAVLWMAFAAREYASEAKLFVRVGRENAALDPTVTKGESISLNTNREEEINSIVEHLRSRALMEKVLAVCEPKSAEMSPEKRDAALRRLQNDVSVFSPRMSTVVTVQSTAGSPKDAQKIVATLVKEYVDDHMRVSRDNGSYDFFLQQSDLLKKQLEAAQKALRDAKDKAGMASVDGRRSALEGQICALETQIHQVNAQQSASEAKLKALQASVESLPEPLLRQMLGGMPHDGLATMEDQLFQLRIQEKEALSKYTPEHPRAQAIHQQVVEVEQALRRETPDRKQVLSALTATAASELTSLTAQKEKLQSQLDELGGELVALNEAEVEITKRTREVAQLETQYLAYTGKREEARIDQALKADRITNVSILQPASFEPRPIRPRKAMILFAGLLAGFVGAVVVVLYSDSSRKGSRAETRTPASDVARGPFLAVRSSRKSAANGGNGVGSMRESEHVDA